MGLYIDGDFLDAEAMFERLTENKFASREYIETLTFGKKTGQQVKVKIQPTTVTKIEGYLKYQAFHYDCWTDIPIENVIQLGQVFEIPPSLFQLPYDKVRISYRAGEEVIPQEIKDAVQEIADLLSDDNMFEWNLPLSQATLDVISKYRK